MKAVIIGAGRIGRGFVASLLKRNKIALSFFDVSPALVQELTDHQNYTVHVLGNAEKNTVIDHYQAHLLSDQEQLQAALEASDIVITAVGGKNLESVGEEISGAYHKSYQAGKTPKNIFITCENWLSPAEDLQNAILQGLSTEERETFLAENDVTQAVIRASGTSAPPGYDLKNSLDTWVQDYWEIPVDRARIKNLAVPDLNFFKFNADFGNMLYQKIYTNNTSVALIAYLGSLKGYTVLSDAANDPEIVKILEQGYEEINHALISQLNVSTESQEEFSRLAKEKYQDKTIIDDVNRIARDPLRKLAPTDRLIGPAQMAIESGIKPEALSLAIAAAIYYENPADEMSMKLQQLRKEKGELAVLTEVSGLQEEEALTQLVLESLQSLKERQWIK